ncbi:MAG: calcium-binding protein [Hyphomonadaceae bacterium]
MPTYVYGTTTNPVGVTIADELRFVYGDDPLDHPNYYNYGTIDVQGDGSTIAFYPYLGNGQSFQTSIVENYGVIRAVSTSSQARTFYAPSWSPDIFNAGLIEAIGFVQAIAIASEDPQQVITNEGDIRAIASDGSAIGVYVPNGGQVHNSGSIFADGATASYGVSVAGAAVDFLLVNDGDIIAEQNSIYSSGVAYFPITPPDLPPPTIINNGLIAGYYAIREIDTVNGPETQIAHVENHGVLDGRVYLGGGADVVLNTNEITGFVDLGAGDDLYDGVAGAAGDVFGWDGRDTLLGGAAADNFFGEAGNDLLSGGGGANMLDGGAGDDVIVAGADDEELVGGDGFDTLDYSLAGSAVQVNLADGISAGGSGSDDLQGFESVRGSAFDDVLAAGAARIDQRPDLFKSADIRAHTLATAVSLDQWFELTANSEIANAETIPHATVTAESYGDVEYYSFTVSQSGAVTIDIDHTYGEDVTVRLVDINGDVLAQANSTPGTDPDPGSGTTADPLLTFNVAAGTTLYIAVLRPGGSGLAHGASYTLNVSLPGAPTTGVSQSIGSVLEGGLGDDTLIGGDGADTASYAHASGGVTVNLDTGQSGGADGADDLFSIENVMGSNFNDVLVGSSAINTVSYAAATGGVIVSLATQSSSGGGGEDTITGFENVIGSAFNDVIAGDAGSNLLDGGLGVDLASYSAASGAIVADLYLGTVTGAGADILYSIEGVVGSAFADTLLGTSGNNIFEGDQGDDIIDGRGGLDIVVYSNASAGMIVDLSAQSASGADGSDTFVDIEGVRGSAYDDVITVSIAPNVIEAGGGDDLVIIASEGQGTDIIDGGAGVDTLRFDVALTVALWGGFIYHTQGTFHQDSISGFENVIGSDYFDSIDGDGLANVLEGRGGSDFLNGFGGDDSLFGGDGNDYIWGGEGNDLLDGGLHSDQMIGGDGDDTYIVDNVNDTVTEGANAGTDAVRSSVTFSLTANIENLTLTGASAINGFGNILNNVITGNGANNQLNGFDGNDILDGGAGADNMFGGNGDDTYYVDHAGDQTTEVSALGGIDTVISSVSRNLTAHIENLTLTGSANLTASGNSLNNTITGNGGNNTLYGFDGNDILNGGAGADTMFGAAGNDYYVVDDVGDITVEGVAGPAGGIDTVESSISRNLNANFENLILTGAAQFGYGNILDNVMTGNGLANGLYGFDGADTLDGGAGADQMFGGNGDDTYIVDNAGDVTSEVSALGGVDTVISSVTRNLTANLENLTLSGSADIIGAGNALNNVITGNGGANTLYGLDGNDRLDGELGADVLQGGQGADTYVFSTAIGAGNVDAINGFNVADDTIELNNAVFTGLSVGALDPGAFVIGASATDADDRIIYNSATGQLFFDADGTGAGAAILFATLSPGLALTSADFIVGGP